MTDSRWLDPEAVARMLRVRVSQLPGLIGRGRIPRPSYHLGYSTPRWDREVLDEALRAAAQLRLAAAAMREGVAMEPARSKEPATASGGMDEDDDR